MVGGGAVCRLGSGGRLIWRHVVRVYKCEAQRELSQACAYLQVPTHLQLNRMPVVVVVDRLKHFSGLPATLVLNCLFKPLIR